MKTFGAILAAIGGIIQLFYSQALASMGEAAETVDTGASEVLAGIGAIGAGVAVLILVLSAFAFMSSGRFAGMLLCIAAVFGFFTGGGFTMALPFLGGFLCIAGGGNRVPFGNNYT